MNYELDLEGRLEEKEGYLILGRAGDTPENRTIALRALEEADKKGSEEKIEGTTFTAEDVRYSNNVLGQVVLLRSRFGDPTAPK